MLCGFPAKLDEGSGAPPAKRFRKESSRVEDQMGLEESVGVSLTWIACCTAAVQDRMNAAR
jgi:hypothetical protein